MSSLPDEDQAPLMPPEAFVPILGGTVAEGRGVLAMPSINPALSPTLDVVGLPGVGWHVRVLDPFGTLVFSVLLKGVDE